MWKDCVSSLSAHQSAGAFHDHRCCVYAARDITRQLRNPGDRALCQETEKIVSIYGLQVHQVFESRAPVILLWDTLGISLGERGVMAHWQLQQHT